MLNDIGKKYVFGTVSVVGSDKDRVDDALKPEATVLTRPAQS